jgi:hypothetical protein
MRTVRVLPHVKKVDDCLASLAQGLFFTLAVLDLLQLSPSSDNWGADFFGPS